ncbi:hypothetical protein [Peribacillus simplex]|nr:hypothetical protein [Peribacillus simplex]
MVNGLIVCGVEKQEGKTLSSKRRMVFILTMPFLVTPKVIQADGTAVLV